MAFKATPTTTSRFQFLVDDAPDPFETVKKAKNKNTNTSQGNKTGAKQNNKKKTTSAKQANNSSDKKDHQSSSDGSKKKKPTSVPNTQPAQNSHPALNTKSDFSQGDNVQTQARHQGISDEFEQWKQRDQDYVSGTFESDLEAALLQSKLEHQQQQTRIQQESQIKAKAKKKPVSVPIKDFHAMLNSGEPLPVQQSPSKSSPSSEWSELNGCVTEFSEKELERLRLDAQMEMRREMRLENERAILQSRNQQVPVPAPGLSMDNLEFRHILVEKDAIIAKLSDEKNELERELEISKTRFKKLWSVVGVADLKDKVVLIAEVDKLTQVNAQLTAEISSLHGQLEQEKSRCHVLILKNKQMEEQSRRRTGSTTE